MTERTAADVIGDTLNQFDSDDFCTAGFIETATARIIAELEWNNFKIIKMVRTERQPRAIEDDSHGASVNSEEKA